MHLYCVTPVKLVTNSEQCSCQGAAPQLFAIWRIGRAMQKGIQAPTGQRGTPCNCRSVTRVEAPHKGTGTGTNRARHVYEPRAMVAECERHSRFAQQAFVARLLIVHAEDGRVRGTPGLVGAQAQAPRLRMRRAAHRSGEGNALP